MYKRQLEDQTMGMAKAAAELIAQNLKYPDGSPVEVVIADTTIGGVAEAAMCQEKFEREGVKVTLTVTPCWCYGTETMAVSYTHLFPRIPQRISPVFIELGNNLISIGLFSRN